MGKVLVFLANGFEEIEALTQVDVLRRAGVEVNTVSINEELMVTGFFNVQVKVDIAFSQINKEEVDMLVLPGGLRGMQNLEGHEDLKELLLDFYKKGKWIAAICASPKIFGGLGIVKGRKATCYPGFEKYLTAATFVDEPVVVDGNVITSRGPGTSAEFALKILEVLVHEEKSQEIRKKMLVK